MQPAPSLPAFFLQTMKKLPSQPASDTLYRAPLREMIEHVYVVVKKDVIREHDVCMTVSIETSRQIAAPPKSTKSRNSDFSISRFTNSK